MCGRYGLEAHYGTSLGGVPFQHEFESWNVAPTQQVPILLDRFVPGAVLAQSSVSDQKVPLPDAPQLPGVHRIGVAPRADGQLYREIYRARWGLIPHWHPWGEDPKPPALTFNARSETLFEKPSYMRPAITGHCAIPTSGYYEWRIEASITTARGATKERKTPQRIGPPHGYLYLAGLYTWHRINSISAEALSTSNYAPQLGEWLLTFSIITMPSPRAYTAADGSPLLRELGQIHERMPLPLADTHPEGKPPTLDAWLGSGQVAGTAHNATTTTRTADIADARASLDYAQAAAYRQAENWRVHQVSERIGNIKNNDKSVLTPDEDLFTLLDSDT